VRLLSLFSNSLTAHSMVSSLRDPAHCALAVLNKTAAAAGQRQGQGDPTSVASAYMLTAAVHSDLPQGRARTTPSTTSAAATTSVAETS